MEREFKLDPNNQKSENDNYYGSSLYSRNSESNMKNHLFKDKSADRSGKINSGSCYENQRENKEFIHEN